MQDKMKLKEGAQVGMSAKLHDEIKWHCHTRLEKFDNHGRLYDTVEIDGNMLMSAGASALWDRLIGGTAQAFNNANATIGVGDSSTAENAAQTNLQGTSARAGMTSGYPLHDSGDPSIDFQASFDENTANFAWNEWGVFNDDTAGVMLNRKVQSLGTKAQGTTWQLTVTLTLVSS